MQQCNAGTTVEAFAVAAEGAEIGDEEEVGMAVMMRYHLGQRKRATSML